MTPDQYTIKESFVDVGDGHELYVHDWGNASAKTPIIHLHGGPGGGTKDRVKQVYDPERQRVIFFDQRGCGRSLPYGSREHNTTKELISDINKVVDYVGVKEFMLHGGSWGSCLALAYAIEHPKRVKAMVLHGIFTGSQTEIDWLDKGLFKAFYPDAWQRLMDETPKSHHDDPVAYHAKRALAGEDEASKKSAYAYESMEAGVIQLDDRFTPSDYAEYDPAGIKIEIDYLVNGCYLPDRHILNNAHKLTMPVYLVQGRYDMVCPPTTAYELQQKLPNGELIYTISGHKPEHETWNIMRTLMLQLSAQEN